MSAEFLDGRRFVFTRKIEIEQDENMSDVMTGQTEGPDGELIPVTITRDDIENGRALFLMTTTSFDDENGAFSVNFDPDTDEDEFFGEAETDLWLVPLEGSDPIGYRYHIDRTNCIVTYETSEGVKTLEGPDFLQFHFNAVRVDETGRMICQFCVPLEVQERVCKENNSNDHLDEITQEFEAMKHDPDGYVQARAYTHDINQIAGDETYTDEIISAKQEAKQETLIESALLGDRTGKEWDILLNNDMFRNPQVRSIFNFFMASRLKDFPIDQVGVVRFDSLEDSISTLSEAFHEQKEVAPFDGGALMPGYRTSPVYEFTDGKMTVITFTDLPGMPAYAYAYPNELTLDADVTPDSLAPTF